MLHCKHEAVEAQSGMAGQQKLHAACHDADITPAECVTGLAGSAAYPQVGVARVFLRPMRLRLF
jgi:hypothetical protein